MSECACHISLPLYRRIFLHNYVVPVYIGVHAHEQDAPQRMRFHIDLYVALTHCTPKHDQLDEVLDYTMMEQAIKQCTQIGHVALQETLCDAIAKQLLQHPKIDAVRVVTEKLDVYANEASVGVEVFLRRSDVAC